MAKDVYDFIKKQGLLLQVYSLKAAWVLQIMLSTSNHTSCHLVPIMHFIIKTVQNWFIPNYSYFTSKLIWRDPYSWRELTHPENTYITDISDVSSMLTADLPHELG